VGSGECLADLGESDNARLGGSECPNDMIRDPRRTNIAVLLVMSPVRSSVLLDALGESVTHLLAVSGYAEAQKALYASLSVQSVFIDTSLSRARPARGDPCCHGALPSGSGSSSAYHQTGSLSSRHPQTRRP